VAQVTAPSARFDRVARIYRAMEVLSFGPMLERCRFHHLPRLRTSRRALVLGDGDGRFLARLFSAAPTLRADAIDGSPAMLDLLRKRVSRLGAQDRLTTTCADARSLRPQSCDYDLVVTHFFLDCLTEPEADRLIARLRRHLASGGRWLISEFQIPDGGRLRAWFARGVISALYAGFRLLTGLTVREIPRWPLLLARHGFTRKASHSWLGGLLVSEVWELREATTPMPPALPPG
jgi:ubiquinone/menaquinone biosynthesis C-methylase UbiE